MLVSFLSLIVRHFSSYKKVSLTLLTCDLHQLRVFHSLLGELCPEVKIILACCILSASSITNFVFQQFLTMVTITLSTICFQLSCDSIFPHSHLAYHYFNPLLETLFSLNISSILTLLSMRTIFHAFCIFISFHSSWYSTSYLKYPNSPRNYNSIRIGNTMQNYYNNNNYGKCNFWKSNYEINKFRILLCSSI